MVSRKKGRRTGKIESDPVPEHVQGPRKVLALNILSISVFIVVVIGYLTGSPMVSLDEWLNEGMAGLQQGVVVEIFKVITAIGNELSVLVVSCIILVILLFRKKWGGISVFLPSMLTGWIAYPLLKSLLGRTRPVDGVLDVGGFALPSGHATMSIILFASLIYIFREETGGTRARYPFIITCVALFLLVGFSRIFLGVHWPSDVLAGFGLGLFILTGYILIIDRLVPRIWTRSRKGS